MNSEETVEITLYKVVINLEEQYSIWPAAKSNPPGWRDAGKIGLKPDCLAYVKEVWTDMTPLTVRMGLRQAAFSRQTAGQENESIRA